MVRIGALALCLTAEALAPSGSAGRASVQRKSSTLETPKVACGGGEVHFNVLHVLLPWLSVAVERGDCIRSDFERSTRSLGSQNSEERPTRKVRFRARGPFLKSMARSSVVARA